MIITTPAKKNVVGSVSIPSFQASRLISLTRCEDSWPSQFALEFRGMFEDTDIHERTQYLLIRRHH
jgi:hypothetical protein